MKYKILINGKNSGVLVKDFFINTGDNFQCLSTSDIWEDITAHMDIFKPDAYMCFYDEFDDNMINQIQSLRNNKKYATIPLIIVGDQDSILMFAKKAPYIEALKIKKPTSTQNMESAIKKHLDEISRNRAAANAEALKAEAAAKAAAEAKAAEAKAAEAPASSAAASLGFSLDDLKKSFDGIKAKKHILVVDDDRSVLKMLKTALEGEYDVTTVVNGKLAVRFLESKTADLILLDYEMPEMSGPEVFVKIKASNKNINIPIVFLTGVADSDRIREVLALKPRGYLLKPVNIERLTSTIKEILQ